MKTKERMLTMVFWLSGILILGILVLIIGYIAIEGITAIDWNFVFAMPSRAGTEGGIFPFIISTLYLIIGSLMVAVPLGVASAIYLEEYASKSSKFAGLVNLTADTLSGIPSIVFGLFGFIFFVIFLNLGWSLLSGCLTLAIMLLPTICRTAQAAILSVPPEYRENSLALGAGKWQTIQKIIIPAALPGIITGIILSAGRAIGETAALILTAGSSLGLPTHLSDPARSMSVHLYILAMEGLSMERAFGTALLVIVLIMFINYLANLSLKRRFN